MVTNRVYLLIAIGMLLIISCVHAEPVTNGLVVYYDGNLSGNSVLDHSGNNNNGIATSATQQTDQSTGANYINVDGNDASYIDVYKNAQTNLAGPISIEFIGSINGFKQYGALVSKVYDDNNGWFLSCSRDAPYNQAKFGAYLTNGIEPSIDTNVGLVAGQGYDIVATYDNSTAYIYVNGVYSGSATWNSQIKGSTDNITLAYGSSRNGLEDCNCNLYTFRLYNRALSPAEVLQNYENDRWRIASNNITMIKRLVYGDRGLPRYMESYAIQQSGSGLNLVDNNLFTYSSVGTPFFQNNGGSLTNCSLIGTTINGIKWKNYYAPGSSAILTYAGSNRSVQNTFLLSNDSFDLTHSVTYSGKTQTVQDGVPVIGGNKYEFYGDGLNTISGTNVMLYTDNAIIQQNRLADPIGNYTNDYTNYQTRNASVTRSSSLDIPLSSPQLTPMPVPSGYLGALIFAEHADYTDHDSLRTVMYGTNDTTNTIYHTKGFIGHNLTATWSVFAKSSVYGEGLDSPTLKSVTDDMYNNGFEIIPHNFIGDVGNGIPNRTDAVTYLPWYYTNYSSRNWIDHGLGGGARNVGLKSCGWDPNSQYYIMDLLQNYSYTYAWFWDPDQSPELLSTSRISSVGLPEDIIWQNTNLALQNGTPLYQWKSLCATAGYALTYYNNSSIDNMLSTYGVSIWHDYWPDDCSGGNAAVPGYYYVQGHPDMINATFDNLLTNISKQKQAGKLWNPTVSQYIDYWIAAKNVDVKCTGNNTYTVENHNSGTVNGFSMRVTGSYTPKLDGVTLNTKTNGVDTIFWMNLPTGTHTITLES